METVRVNMIPNGEVKTIHCSKGDGKTRKWGFELYKEDGIIPSSSISPQMFFDSYKGGTEQILPENTSVPTTSPIIADIQYKDALRSEQEFLYRESPATVDGKAKITKIKGNTVVFNQLVQNGNFADTSVWTTWQCSLSVANNIATITSNSSNGNIYKPNTTAPKIVVGHKYYFTGDIKCGGASSSILFKAGSATQQFDSTDTSWKTFGTILTATISGTDDFVQCVVYANGSGGVTQARNLMCIDLTKMGLDTLTVDQFTSLYPLPYYDYTTGKLLPFKGESLKTVGFNQWDEEWEEGAYNQNTGEKISAPNIWRSKNYTRVLQGTYYFKCPITIRIFWYDGDYVFLGSETVLNATKTIPTNAMFVTFHVGQTSYNNDVCINISDTQKNGQYKAYQTSTLSLPISDYFPTGMKSAGSVYDEITESKAYTRLDIVVDLGALTWIRGDTNTTGEYRFYSTEINSIVKKPPNNDTLANILCGLYLSVTANQTYAKSTGVAIHPNGSIFIYDESKKTMTADQFKESVNGVSLIFELATPTETTINTASLVSEQAEIPLYEDDDILIGECTTQLSSKSGFIPTKIKYQDDNGVAYSQKINLHVEK